MAEIKMTRVDFRLVHGQIVVKWCKACDVDNIVVIDDVVASRTVRRKRSACGKRTASAKSPRF